MTTRNFTSYTSAHWSWHHLIDIDSHTQTQIARIQSPRPSTVPYLTSHRSSSRMAYRELPVGNKLVMAMQRKRDHATHKGRIIANPPSVDDQPPKTYYININRAKKDQMTDELCDKIDRENRLLLRKMTSIIQTHTLDVIHPSYRHSLNEGVRRREMKKIMDENNAILTRITERRAHYDREEWNQHREKHSAYLANIREKPIPAQPIPPPKFLKDGQLTNRPPHAYVHGNYSLSRTRPSPSQTDYSSYSSGSQTARQFSSSSNYTPYQPLTPNRTGASKSHSQGRVHNLQPIPPINKSNSTSPRQQGGRTLQPSNSGINKMLEQQAIKAGYTPIMQSGRNIDSSYVIVAVHEVPGSPENEEKQNHSSSSVQYYSSSSPPSSPAHSLLFCSYDPLESDAHSVFVPLEAIYDLPEVRSNSQLLVPTHRIELANALLDRLTLHNGELRFVLGAVPAPSTNPTASQNDHTQSTEQTVISIDRPSSSFDSVAAAAAAVAAASSTTATATQPTSSTEPATTTSASTQPLPTPETHPIAYTDSTGVNYYYDVDKSAYLPFPTITTATTTTADSSAAPPPVQTFTIQTQ